MKLNEAMCCKRLGLSMPSNVKEVRKTYKTLARTLHPDVGGDEEAFKEVSAAYQYLLDLYEKNPNKKRPTYSSSSKSSTSSSSKSSSSSSSKESSSSKGSSSQTSSSTSSSSSSRPDPDYQEAWKTWRSQYSAYQSSADSAESTRRSSRRTSSENNPHVSPSDTYSTSTQSSSKTESDQQQTQPTEVDVEVVPSFGDQLGRWSSQVKTKAVRWIRSQSRNLHERGKDEKLRLDIDEYTLFFGSQKRIAIKRSIACPQCQDPTSSKTALDQAQGCLICDGEGRVADREEINLYLPPGAQTGEKLKVSGKGTEGLCGQKHGDLYLIIHPPSLPSGFSRKGADLYLDLSVPSEILKRGGPVSFSTPRGPLSVKVPPNSSVGRKLSVRDHGLPYWNEEEKKGNLFIILRSSSK